MESAVWVLWHQKWTAGSVFESIIINWTLWLSRTFIIIRALKLVLKPSEMPVGYRKTFQYFNSYWQIEVPKADLGKTSFAWDTWLFQYIRMIFGVPSAPVTFRRDLDIILPRFKSNTFLFFIEVITMFSQIVDRQIKGVDQILTALGCAEIPLKIENWKLFIDAMEYLCHLHRAGKL